MGTPPPEPTPDKPRWVLTFKAEGDGPPVECRVRRLLKAALRAYGLRCLDHRTIGDDKADDPTKAMIGQDR